MAIKEIVTNVDILKVKSERFVLGEDDHIIEDMIDTANYFKDTCVGLAAVQIGVHKKVILVRIKDRFIPMINPTIIRYSGKTYIATEGCLSLFNERRVKRYREIKVIYTDTDGTSKCSVFRDQLAQIIQHECDHLNGVLI